ncbi:MAG TPA: hypothetical protein VMN60_08700 [Longimicrobiales bacterium]|nr:hypothetical protein [Longimicrobiales bacterium]
MRTVKVLSLLFVLALASAAAAQAQACLGLPSFGNASVHVNVGAEFPDSATVLAAGVGGGRDRSAFGNIGAGQITYEGYDGKTTFGFLELGYQLVRNRLHFCPIASFYVGAGPNDDEIGIDYDSRGAAAGLALGMPVATPFATLIPNVAIRYARDELTTTEEGFDGISETFDGGVIDIGLGFVFRDRLSIQPLVHFPFGGDDDQMNFGFFAAFRFNWSDW